MEDATQFITGLQVGVMLLTGLYILYFPGMLNIIKRGGFTICSRCRSPVNPHAVICPNCSAWLVYNYSPYWMIGVILLAAAVLLDYLNPRQIAYQNAPAATIQYSIFITFCYGIMIVLTFILFLEWLKSR